MNCKETQDKIQFFLQEALELEQLNLFLEHIERCETCREELEVYYTLYTGMQILEEETHNEKNGYEINLQKELERVKEKFRRARRKKMQKNILLFVLIIIIGIFIL